MDQATGRDCGTGAAAGGGDAARVRLLVLDVDGVLTDGSVVLGTGGMELKAFSTRDGFGLRLWREAGGAAAIVTGRGGEAVRTRAGELGIGVVLEGVKEKGEGLRRACAACGVGAEETAAIGDDWPDLAMMRACGYPMAVADAEPEVRAAARWVTPRAGGRGAVRDAVGHLLRARGVFEAAVARYAGGG